VKDTERIFKESIASKMRENNTEKVGTQMNERPLIELLREKERLMENLEILNADLESCDDTKMQEELKRFERLIDSLKYHMETVTEHISLLERTLKENKEKMSELETSISNTKEKLEKTQQEIDNLRVFKIIVYNDGNIKKDDDTELNIPDNWEHELSRLMCSKELFGVNMGLVLVLAKAISVCRATDFLCEVEFEDKTLEEIFKKVV